jgi:hypothetical protein
VLYLSSKLRHNQSIFKAYIFTSVVAGVIFTPFSAIKPDFLENEKYHSSESDPPIVKFDGLHFLYSHKNIQGGHHPQNLIFDIIILIV